MTTKGVTRGGVYHLFFLWKNIKNILKMLDVIVTLLYNIVKERGKVPHK
nr:MAG TPA: hypothetical protein [Caudoviricetes sp.]